jgi:hypothetical protein
LRYHPAPCRPLTRARHPGGGQRQAGSLTGAVASQRVTEAREGPLRLFGNQPQSAMVQGGLTARRTRRAVAKAGHSDPVAPNGRAIAQRIKGTPGITGLSSPRVHIDGKVWHLDVDSSHPGAGAGPKGSAVRRSIAVRELGSERRETVRSLSSVGAGDLRGAVPSTRGPGRAGPWCSSCGSSRSAG